MDIKYFKEICRSSPKTLLKNIPNILEKCGYKEMFCCEDYAYAKGSNPVLLVAHVDTVHFHLPEDIFFDQQQQVMWSPDGIGGDDRCGVYAILKLINKFNPSVLFTNGEEAGATGSNYLLEDLPKLVPDVRFILELDRKGANDCVFYSCGNKEFQQFVSGFGFKKNFGTFSDISVLAPAWNIAAANLSVGYYNEHSSSEFVNVGQLEMTIQRVANILSDKGKNKFDFQEVVYKTKFATGYYGKWDEKTKTYVYPDGKQSWTNSALSNSAMAGGDEYDDDDAFRNRWLAASNLPPQ